MSTKSHLVTKSRRIKFLGLEVLERREVLSTFTVVNVNDSGAGSLRQAILDANANSSLNTIAFNIPGTGVQKIRPTSPLPNVTDATVIDATTQPGYTAGHPVVDLDGSNIYTNYGSGSYPTPGVNGLTLTGGNSTVKGLIINRFTGDGILLSGNSRNVIQGNLIGTDETGMLQQSNGSNGVEISYSRNNIIGGGSPDLANVISGNSANGILVVGGSLAGGNQIEGNKIGVAADGVTDIGNRQDGVQVQTSNNQIGGGSQNLGNIIAFNGGYGVNVQGFFYNTLTGNSVLTNSIYSNVLTSINLNTNNTQTRPVISSVYQSGTTTTIEGTVTGNPNTDITLQFFSSVRADPSGSGPGQTYLNQTVVTTDFSGFARFSYVLSPQVVASSFVTATATDSVSGNTSTFSQPRGSPRQPASTWPWRSIPFKTRTERSLILPR